MVTSPPMRKLALLLPLYFGCGDNISPAMPDAPATPDAPPPFMQAPHDPPPQVSSAGGSVLDAPKVQPIFYTGDASQAQIEQLLQGLPGSSYWKTTTTEYGVGDLVLLPSIVSTDMPPTTDEALQAALLAEFPTWDPETIYTVFLPDGVVLSAGGSKSCQSFGGYHDEALAQTGMGSGSGSGSGSGGPPPGPGLVYALVPHCPGAVQPLDEVTLATSHELIEASTDPHPQTAPAFLRVDADHFIWGRTPGGELGDMCEYVQTAGQRLIGDFMVQRTWSNASAAAGHDPCVPALSSPYVGAAPELQDVTVMSHGQMITTKAIPVAPGASVTIPVDVFSDAPTGVFEVRVEDVKALQGGTPDLTFSLDKPVGANGDKLMLTITRAASATSTRGSEFVITARANNLGQSMWWAYSTVATM